MEHSKKINSIVLVEPTNKFNVKHPLGGHNEFEPLGIEYIASYLMQNGYNVNIIRQMSKSTEEVANDILALFPTIAGFSVLTYNIREAQDIAEKLKEKNKEIITIFGGYHVSADPEVIKEDKNIDFIVIGEGESTFLRLIKAIENGKDYSNIDGIAFMADGGYVRKTPKGRIKCLDDLPFPLRYEHILRDCRIYGLMFPAPSQQKNVSMVLGSRGCPFDCDFCSSKSIWGREVAYRSPQNIIKELMEIKKKFKSDTVFFSDLTFNLNKGWLKEICSQIIYNNFKINWYCMCSISDLDEETIELMSKSGCKKIGFGIERLNGVLPIKGFKLPTLGEMNFIFDICEKQNILTKAYLMIGFPDEDCRVLEEYKRNILGLKVDEIKISFLTPFPGTEAYRKYRGMLTTNDWRQFDTFHLMIANDNLNEEEYGKFRKEVIKEFYTNTTYLEGVARKIESNKSFSASYEEFFKFLSL